jgi:hypothetical protein
MHFSRHIFFFLLLLCGATLLRAQGEPGRVKKLLLKSDTLQLDTLSLIPGTVQLSANGGHALDTSGYSIDYSNARILFKKHPSDTLYVHYKVFPYLFTKPMKHKDYQLLQPNSRGFVNPFAYNTAGNSNDLFKMEGLTKSGSISRGVSFGNNQDLAVNSSLNLQLAGKLSNDVDIVLAASDQNIPIQPQGNTQNLQEFDKVFIQLSNKTSKLIAGDFIISKPNGYFLNYNKKVQGLGFSTIIPMNPMLKDSSKMGFMHLSANAAISKGKFGRMQLPGVEGNQGPYRLRGAENEQFIIVLSGSEKVYIDGTLLKRGQEYDYVIDYNTAEVTFTPKNLITKDKRIIVEFQYSDKNYARSIITFDDEYTKNKLKVHFNIYSEQDSKNQPLQQALSDSAKLLLHNIGDTLQKAYIPAAQYVPFSNSLPLYRKLDSTDINGTFKSVYVYSTDTTLAHYKVSFSDLGPGNGDYVQIPSAANGRVFKWVEPIAGVHQGNYAPVILLITPKKKQMVTLGGEYKFSKNTILTTEGALSNYNQNTFSPYDHEHDMGYAFKLNFVNKTNTWKDITDTAQLRRLSDAFVKTNKNTGLTFDPTSQKESVWTFTKNLSYEYTQQDFNAIERYRSVEFERDWNIGSLTSVSDQHLIGAGISAARSHYGNVTYTASSFLEGSQYSGIQNAVSGLFDHSGFLFRGDASLLNSQGSQSNTQFLRHKADLSKRLGKITIGIKEQQEQNLIRAAKVDTLLPTSFNYFEWQAYVENADTVKNKYRLSYKHRDDFAARSNTMNPLSKAEDIAFSMSLLKNPRNELKITTTYRQLDILNPSLSALKPENTLLGRIEYNLRLLKGFLTAGTFYEAGSGLELKKEYSYVQVPAGQGQYTWIDYNGDGIQQLNEFQIALFPDQATYIRVWTPTDQYIKAFTNQFSQNLFLKPAAIWANKTGFRKVLSHFADQSTYRVDRKTTDDRPEVAYNPFLKSILDTALVTLNSSFRNSLYFNQSDPVFGVDLTFQDVRNKSLLTTGFESRLNDFNELRVRWNFNKTLGLIASGKLGEKSNTSQFFNTLNYDLTYKEVEPKLNIQPNTKFRLTFDYRYAEKKNLPDLGGESVFINSLSSEVKYNMVGKGSISAKVSYIQIAYNASLDNAVAYEMLEGLRTGKNVTWGFGYQRTLSNNIQVNITYEGRQSENTKIVHTGGATVRAFF